MYPPIYRTQRFSLLPYRLKDEDRFVEMTLDPMVLRFMGGGGEGDETSERKFFQKIFSIYEKKEMSRWFWIWGIYDGDKLCGHFELKDTQYTDVQELEIVYMVHPKERRRGIISEVLAFFKAKQGEWNRRIIATVNTKNQASISLLEAWGISQKEIIHLKEGDPFYKIILNN